MGASQLKPSDMVGKCREEEKCNFPDFFPCFCSSSARSQTQGYSMSITCLCKDRPRVTAGATVPGVSAALNVEEVRGEDLIHGGWCGVYIHTLQAV